ncbi:MAG: hypothetical protein QW524_01405, partial [Candidatus Woesearchaeota archaeon]
MKRFFLMLILLLPSVFSVDVNPIFSADFAFNFDNDVSFHRVDSLNIVFTNSNKIKFLVKVQCAEGIESVDVFVKRNVSLLHKETLGSKNVKCNENSYTEIEGSLKDGFNDVYLYITSSPDPATTFEFIQDVIDFYYFSQAPEIKLKDTSITTYKPTVNINFTVNVPGTVYLFDNNGNQIASKKIEIDPEKIERREFDFQLIDSLQLNLNDGYYECEIVLEDEFLKRRVSKRITIEIDSTPPEMEKFEICEDDFFVCHNQTRVYGSEKTLTKYSTVLIIKGKSKEELSFVKATNFLPMDSRFDLKTSFFNVFFSSQNVNLKDLISYDSENKQINFVTDQTQKTNIYTIIDFIKSFTIFTPSFCDLESDKKSFKCLIVLKAVEVDSSPEEIEKRKNHIYLLTCDKAENCKATKFIITSYISSEHWELIAGSDSYQPNLLFFDTLKHGVPVIVTMELMQKSNFESASLVGVDFVLDATELAESIPFSVGIEKWYSYYENGKLTVFVYLNVRTTITDFTKLPKYLNMHLKLQIAGLLPQLGQDKKATTSSIYLYPLSFEIQTPFFDSKILNPQMMDKLIGFVNVSLNIVNKTLTYVDTAQRIATMSCAGLVLWNTLEEAFFKRESQAKIPMIAVCERVICSYVPQKCKMLDEDGLSKISTEGIDIVEGDKEGKFYVLSCNSELAKKYVKNCPEGSFVLVKELSTSQEGWIRAGTEEVYYRILDPRTVKTNIATVCEKGLISNLDNIKKECMSNSEKVAKFCNDCAIKFLDSSGTLTRVEINLTNETCFKAFVTEIVHNISGYLLGAGACSVENSDDGKIDYSKSTACNVSRICYDRDNNRLSDCSGDVMKVELSVEGCDRRYSEQEIFNSMRNDVFLGGATDCYIFGTDPYMEYRCLANLVNPGEPIFTGSPQDNLFSSVMCGCIPGVGGHLENLRSILQAAKECFEGVKQGIYTAGHCEFLLAVYACDMILDVTKKLFSGLEKWFVKQEIGKEKVQINEYTTGVISKRSNYIRSQTSAYYANIVFSAFRTDKIRHQTCYLGLGLIFGQFSWDEIWNLFGEVSMEIGAKREPQIIPPVGYSRYLGYDALSRVVNIYYFVGLSIFSGSNPMEYELYFHCDPSMHEDPRFCGLTQKSVLVEKGYVGRNSRLQKTIVLKNSDLRNKLTNADRYIFNLGELVVRYKNTQGGDVEKRFNFKITQKFSSQDLQFYCKATDSGLECGISAEVPSVNLPYYPGISSFRLFVNSPQESDPINVYIGETLFGELTFKYPDTDNLLEGYFVIDVLDGNKLVDRQIVKFNSGVLHAFRGIEDIGHVYIPIYVNGDDTVSELYIKYPYHIEFELGDVRFESNYIYISSIEIAREDKNQRLELTGEDKVVLIPKEESKNFILPEYQFSTDNKGFKIERDTLELIDRIDVYLKERKEISPDEKKTFYLKVRDDKGGESVLLISNNLFMHEREKSKTYTVWVRLMGDTNRNGVIDEKDEVLSNVDGKIEAKGMFNVIRMRRSNASNVSVVYPIRGMKIINRSFQLLLSVPEGGEIFLCYENEMGDFVSLKQEDAPLKFVVDDKGRNKGGIYIV